MMRLIARFHAQWVVALMIMFVGCVSSKSERQKLEPEDIRHISVIVFRVTKDSNYEEDGAIEFRVWWEDVWKEAKDLSGNTLVGDDPKRWDALTDYRASDLFVIPPFKTTTHNLNKEFSFGVKKEVDPSFSEYFYYLKGSEWRREEKFRGFMVRGEIVQATSENIHLRGTISRLDTAPFSYVWPFDVIIPYEKHVIVWEMQEIPKASTVFL